MEEMDSIDWMLYYSDGRDKDVIRKIKERQDKIIKVLHHLLSPQIIEAILGEPLE